MRRTRSTFRVPLLAISGVVLARAGGYSLFGAFVIAALPTVGGGTLRDLLVNRHPSAS